ncbi:Transcriptional regulator, AraC family protein [Minicystis rosea]|nr:Transcriptional regulator, AraC family protein [Minicystis rosea]
MISARLHDDVLRRIAAARERMHDESHEALRVVDLARTACLSEQHFVRLFREIYGVSPGRYLGSLRIAHAKRLLSHGMSVTEVCMSVGYASLGTFSHRFTRETLVSPKVFQRQMRAFGAVPERLAALFVPACFMARYARAQNVHFGEVRARPLR